MASLKGEWPEGEAHALWEGYWGFPEWLISGLVQKKCLVRGSVGEMERLRWRNSV